MHLSKRGEYGLRAMIDLAGGVPSAIAHDDESINKMNIMQIKDIAARQQIPAKFLEQILLSLKNAGLLNSKMGVGGGYYLAKNPAEITLGQIIRILDGPIAPIRCVSQMAYEPCGCPDERTCGLRMVMGDVRDAMVAILDNTTLLDISRRVSDEKQALRNPD
jgi:Rrf2 family protein